MKAFISHSSKDKGFVNALVEQLRPGSYELDSETFDFGILNSQAILRSLERSDLYCLLLSSHSLTSQYVAFETLLGSEFFASGKISRFLVICIDSVAFDRASDSVKYFNAVRLTPSPDSAARLIQGQLISAAQFRSTHIHPFIGREDEIAELGKQTDDYRRPPSKALFLSGNFGSGRRTIAQHFYRNYFPQVGQVFPTINIDAFAGLEEFYQATLSALRPSMLARELLSRLQGFRVASRAEQTRLIAQQFNALLPHREAVYIIDEGGVLNDAGGLTQEVEGVLDHLNDQPHPVVVFISPRMVPRKYRRAGNDVSYLAVKSLKREAAEGLIARLIRDRGITPSEQALDALFGLSDSEMDPENWTVR